MAKMYRTVFANTEQRCNRVALWRKSFSSFSLENEILCEWDKLRKMRSHKLSAMKVSRHLCMYDDSHQKLVIISRKTVICYYSFFIPCPFIPRVNLTGKTRHFLSFRLLVLKCGSATPFTEIDTRKYTRCECSKTIYSLFDSSCRKLKFCHIFSCCFSFNS